MRYGHDWLIVGYTIWSPVQIRSYIRSDRIVPIESMIGSQCDTIMSIGFPDYVQIRSDTFRYVHHEPMRSVAIGYDCGRDIFHDEDRE